MTSLHIKSIKLLHNVHVCNCLFYVKGSNSSVKELISTKLVGYRLSVVLIIYLSMVLIIYTKNASNPNNSYRDIVLDGCTNGQTYGTTLEISFRGDNK